jgi:hypothetical protein
MDEPWVVGTDADLYLRDDGQTVVKVMNAPSHGDAVAQARREADYMVRLSVALRDVEALGSPALLELVDGPDLVAVVMTRCPGQELTHYVQRPMSAHERHKLATAVVRMIQTYLETFGEPHYDFVFANLLYDGVRLSLVDFTLPRHFADIPTDLRPAEVALASFIGSALYQAAFPSGWWRLRANRDLTALVGEVIRRAGDLIGPVDIATTRSSAWDAYWRAAAMRPGVRTVWYRTAGLALARRGMRCMGLTNK